MPFVSRKAKASCRCQQIRRTGKRLPLIALGASTSLVPCPPMGAILLLAANKGSVFTGITYGLVFGAGLMISPLVAASGSIALISDTIRQKVNWIGPYLQGVSMAIMFGMEYIKYVIDCGIIGLLIFMSLAALAIGTERFLYFKTLKTSDFDDRKSLELALTDRLHLIASIGSNAPYIGFSFFMHASILGVILGVCPALDLQPKPTLIDFSLLPAGGPQIEKQAVVSKPSPPPPQTVYKRNCRKKDTLSAVKGV